MTGNVILVGAGPGDPGLLTLRGKQALEQAEVVVYDRLAGQGVLELIPPEAEKIDVGKQAGRHPVPQSRINEILLEQSLAGKRVVRLKGGDPFVFGRGGEELEALAAQGVPFEVVPGVTSALAAPAYAGIPVTHRNYCSSLHIITGHKQKNGKLELDYQTLAKLEGTLIFLMSVASAPQIAAGLLEAGMDGGAPAAIVENGARPNQRSFVCPLNRLAQTMEEQAVQSPAVLLIGGVASLASQFNWYEKLPLKGKRILITRPQQEGQALAARLAALGAQGDCLPAVRRQPLPFSWPPEQDFDWLLFSSIGGVDAFFQGLRRQGLDARRLAGKKLAAVGPKTAQALERYGLLADFVPKEYSGQALARQMLAQNLLNQQSRALIPRAETASPGLTDELDQAHIPWQALAVYRVIPCSPERRINPSVYDAILFTSASTAESFAACCPAETDFSALPALCIGAQTAARARGLGMNPAVSPEATVDSMIETLIGGFFHD